jgi:hypothetical protein
VAGTTIAQQVAREYCRKFPSTSTRELARTLQAKEPKVFGSWNAARQAIRWARGQMTKGTFANRKPVATKPRVEIPASDAKPLLPAEFTPTGYGTVIADVHIPYHDEQALRAALDHACDKGATDFLLILGDLLDCYQLSRFCKDPRQRDFAGEVQRGQKFLQSACGVFGRVWYKLGNHEVRYERYLMDHAAQLLNLPTSRLAVILDTNADAERLHLPITYVEANQALYIGEHLTALHGHEYGRGMQSPVNPARGMFLRASASILSADSHQTSNHVQNDVRGNVISCWSLGALCDLHPSYASFNKWNHGFALLRFDGDQFEVENKKIIHGKVY